MALAGVGVVEIRPDMSGFTRDLNRSVDRSMSGMSSRFKSGFKTAGKAALIGGAALGGLAVAGFSKAFNEAQEAAKIGKLTDAVLKSTGGVAKVTRKEIDALAESLSRKAGVDDEVIQEGENMLLTFTKVRNEAGKGNDVFNQATKAALNMSVALGTDMKGASMQVGKALNDPVKGITALSRAGVSFTEQQKEQVKWLVASGDQLGAQKIILGELKTQFGGAAEAAATPMDRLQVAWGNLMETVGTAVMPLVEKLATWLADKLPKALDWARKAWGRFMDGFNGVGGKDDGLKRFGEIARNVVNYIRDELIPWVRDKLWPVVQDYLGRISDAAVKLWRVAKPVLEAIVGFIRDRWIPFIRKVWEVNRDVYGFIVDKTQWLWNRMRPVVEKIVDFIRDPLIPIFQSIWEKVRDTFNNVRDKAQWLWGVIKHGPIGKLVGWIGSTVVPKLGEIASAVGNVFQAIPDAIAAALRTAGNLVAGFLNAAAWIADKIGLDSIAESLRGAASSADSWGESAGASAIGGPSGNNTVMPLARGGRVPGPNVNRDVVPAMLTPGEFVLRKSAVQRIGVTALERMNRGVRGFADGGYVFDPDVGFIDPATGQVVSPVKSTSLGQALHDIGEWSVDKLRSMAASALGTVWPKLPVPGNLLGLVPGGVNYARQGIIDFVAGESRKLAAPTLGGGGFSRAGGGGPAGAYTPGMLAARAAILGQFGPMVVGGYAGRNIAGTNTPSAHSLWRAWDFMVGLGNTARGNAIADFLIRNASQYGLKGLIWNAMSNFGGGWKPYSHPGGLTDPTRMHLDHIHAEFFRQGGLVHGRSFDSGGVLQPGWNVVRNDTGAPEAVSPGRGVYVENQFINAREDVDEFYRRAYMYERAGAL